MTDLAILIKSYQGDLAIAQQLLDSLDRYNSDSIPVYLVVPQADASAFQEIAPSSAEILHEEVLREHLVKEPFGGMTTGYINQQIVKLAFWELGLAENYLVLDSDVEMIRPFVRSEFLAPDGLPYSVLTQDKDMLADPHYFNEQWRTREEWINSIAQELGYEGPWPVRTCHANTVFNSGVLRSIQEQVLHPRGWDYTDLLRTAPYEFSWYNIWLQVSETIPVRSCEPWIKTFHSESEHLAFLAGPARLEDVSRAYAGISVQSNFARHKGLPPTSASKEEFLSKYLSYGEYLRLGVAKARDTWTRRSRRSSR
jgi:hypothetical protein